MTTTNASPRKVSDGALIKRLARELVPYRAAFVFACLLYLPLTTAQILQPVFIGFAVDQGYRHKDMGPVTMWAGAFMASVLARALVETLQLFVMQRMGQRAVLSLRKKLFAKIQRLPMAYFDRNPLGRIMTRVTNDTESVAELFSSGAVSIVGDLLFLLGTLVMLLLVDVQLSLATLLTIPVLAIGVQWFRIRSRSAFSKVRTALSTMNGTLQEMLSGMSIIQLFAQGPRMRAKFEEENKAYMLANREAIALDAGVYAFVDAIGTIAIAVALAAGGVLAAGENSGLTIGVLITFIEALGRFFIPIRELSNKTTVIQSALVSAERIVELEGEPEPITSPQAPSPAAFKHELRFENVRFKYGDPKGNAPEVLKGVTLSVKKGERVAVVGHTGAGKSTVVKLVPRLYDVTAGRITIDGIDIREMDPSALRKLTTAVPQDVFLFAGTLRENLAFARPDASDDELLRAARACQAEHLIDKHGGLDGKVAERGVNLSLGERQLLALARALLTDPPILILDEATASVDRATERALQVATEKLIEGRTAMIVAHRLSTIERCDRIFVLHKGELVEEGTHDELVAKGGTYATYVDLQRRGGG
jgi:ATP-binding cassette, subfamily B, multidrug efflux pump